MIKFRDLKRNEMPGLISLMMEIIPKKEYYPRKNLRIFLREYSRKHLLELYGRTDSIFIVAEENQKLVGFLFGWNEYGVFWVDWLGVEDHKRREHIATHMIILMEKKARKMKCHKIFLDTSCTNFPAVKLYKRLGYFIECKVRNHWLKWDYYLISKFLD